MYTYDISHLAIRVILNKDMAGIPSAWTPHDVEGTLLSVEIVGDMLNDMAIDNLFIHLSCSTQFINRENDDDNYCMFLVRWDNDKKNRLPAGIFRYRSSKPHILCESVWNNYKDIIVRKDVRPYYLLKPVSRFEFPTKKKLKINTKAQGLKISYGGLPQEEEGIKKINSIFEEVNEYSFDFDTALSIDSATYDEF